MWDKAVSCGTEQSIVGQSSFMCYKAVSCRRTGQSYVGQSKSSLRYVAQRQSNVGLSSLMWDRAVSYGSEQSHVGLTSLMWVRKV